MQETKGNGVCEPMKKFNKEISCESAKETIKPQQNKPTLNKDGKIVSRAIKRKIEKQNAAIGLVYKGHIKSFKRQMEFDKSKLDYTVKTKEAIKSLDHKWRRYCTVNGIRGEQANESFINEVEVIKAYLILDVRDGIKADSGKITGLHKQTGLEAAKLADLYKETYR
jgi:hypothetical protein